MNAVGPAEQPMRSLLPFLLYQPRVFSSQQKARSTSKSPPKPPLPPPLSDSVNGPSMPVHAFPRTKYHTELVLRRFPREHYRSANLGWHARVWADAIHAIRFDSMKIDDSLLPRCCLPPPGKLYAELRRYGRSPGDLYSAWGEDGVVARGDHRLTEHSMVSSSSLRFVVAGAAK